MKYNSHVIKLSVFLILCCIGYFIHKKLKIYRENFKENREVLIKTSIDRIETRLCDINTYDNFLFRHIVNLSGDAERTMKLSGDYFTHSKNIFAGISGRSGELISIYPSMKNEVQPIKDTEESLVILLVK